MLCGVVVLEKIRGCKTDTFAFLLLFLCYLFIAMKEKENLFLFTALFIRL